MATELGDRPSFSRFHMKKALFILPAIAVVWFIFLREDVVRLEPGVKAPDPPEQVKVASPKGFPFKGYTITPIAKFHIKAKVLSRKCYRTGREVDLAPVDLALGWGRMSDQKVVDLIDISQSGRWYEWWVREFPIPQGEIESHSANMHLIAADEATESMIKRVRRGEIVEFSGGLVRVSATDGWHWTSSLSRMDTGSHACELVWVESFDIQGF